MSTYHTHIRPNQTFSALMRELSSLPSPKTKFFNRLLDVLGVAPATLRMVLCSTPSGYDLSDDRKAALEHSLQIPASILFPEKRMAKGSLVDMYIGMSLNPVEYEELLSDVQEATGVGRDAIVRWGAGKHRPATYRQDKIASLLNTTAEELFPPVRERELAYA